MPAPQTPRHWLPIKLFRGRFQTANIFGILSFNRLKRVQYVSKKPEDATKQPTPGGIMTPAIKLPGHLLHHCKMLADRETLLWFLPKKKVIVEVGVGLGDFSTNFLNYCDPSHFVAIDLFDLHESAVFWNTPTADLFRSMSHLAYYEDKLSKVTHRSNFTLLKGDSSSQIRLLDDKSVDIFYVDGDHSYEGVCQDLSVIQDKIKDDGLIIMNDYIMRDDGGDYGVIQATNEFMVAHDWEMIFFCLQPMMYCDVVLRRHNRRGNAI